MSCDKCGDIHTAQKEGKTQEECQCSCHKDNPLVNPDTNPTTVWPYYIPCFQPCTPCCTPCCPCTDPNNAGKPMWLVCNCPCHGHMFNTTGTANPLPLGGTTFCCTASGAQDPTQGPIRTWGDY